MYDLVIRNGRIIDGTGSPAFLGDIAVTDGKITKIAKEVGAGCKEIDAAGLTVTPGFIDSHSHSDASVFSVPEQTEKIEQGITTSVGGQCGSSNAPISRDVTEDQAVPVGKYGKNTDLYRTFGTFMEAAQKVPLGANLAIFVGHSALRRAVMGIENRIPTAEEMERMKQLLRDAMENGALGMSMGLIYVPGCFAETEELIALAKVVAEYHGVVTAHLRDEGDYLVRATDEFIRILREAGVRGVISHHKSMGYENWGKVTHTLRMIDGFNAEGGELYCDAYPYEASSSGLEPKFIPTKYRSYGLREALAHPEVRRELWAWNREKWGRWIDRIDWILLTYSQAYPQYAGKYICEIAKLHGKDDLETVFDLIMGGRCSAFFFMMCPEDTETVLRHPRTMICTDAGVAGGKSGVHHPRMTGTFPKVLGRYVRERGITTLPEMIRKMTSMPATVYGLRGKGLLKEGFDGDICIFDAEKIIDRATYTDSHARAEGLHYVIVGGEVVVENAVHNGKRAGKVIAR